MAPGRGRVTKRSPSSLTPSESKTQNFIFFSPTHLRVLMNEPRPKTILRVDCSLYTYRTSVL